MSRTFVTTYKTTALLRLLLVAAVYVLNQLQWQYRSRSGLFPDGINIDFDWYIYAVMTAIMALLAVITLFQPVAAFAPQRIRGLLRRKGFMWFIWVAELLFAAGFVWIAAEEVRSEFFAPPPTFVDSLFAPLSSDTPAAKSIRQVAAVNSSTAALCFVFFACCTWRYRNGWLRSTAETDAA